MNCKSLALAAIAVGGALATASQTQAHADPPCAAVNVCQYMPNPSYNGPLMPTWDTPGVYGGITNGPVQCNTASYSCSTVETEQGDE